MLSTVSPHSTRNAFPRGLASRADLRAAVYLRVSRPEQAKGWSLDGQYREIRAYCDRHGYKVVRRFQDVESGRNPDRRSFLQMTAQAARGCFDVVVVWRRDRFGRDLVNNQLVEGLLKQNGVRLESVAMGPQHDSAQTRLWSRFQDAMDEYEAESINERLQLGKRESAQRGIWPTKPPYGYQRHHKTRCLEPEPTEAENVAWAFQFIADGGTIRDAADHLDKAHTTVRNWIRNPAYLGNLQYEDIRVPAAWPALVSAELAERAEAALKVNRRNTKCNKKPTPRENTE